jgi:hypothetical protein
MRPGSRPAHELGTYGALVHALQGRACEASVPVTRLVPGVCVEDGTAGASHRAMHCMEAAVKEPSHVRWWHGLKCNRVLYLSCRWRVGVACGRFTKHQLERCFKQ